MAFTLRSNDYGHAVGDAVLQQLANRLVATFPRKTDFIARYGKEEFCALLLKAGQELSQRLGERLLDAVRREEFHYHDMRIPATVSVGVAELMPGETAYPRGLSVPTVPYIWQRIVVGINYVFLSRLQVQSRNFSGEAHG
jgi:diguanylate cyclase (GGDEF)-like protein